jgi:hypothetical protein
MWNNSLSSFTLFWLIVDENNNGAISLSSEEGGYWKQGKNTMKRKNSWTTQKCLPFWLSLVKSFKDLKWYHYLEATSTGTPSTNVSSIGTPSHCCDVLDNDNIPSQDHIQTILHGKVRSIQCILRHATNCSSMQLITAS